MSNIIKKSMNKQKKNNTSDAASVVPQGKPVYTANLDVGTSTIKVEVINPAKPCLVQEFDHNGDFFMLFGFLLHENVRGVRLKGKKNVCLHLAEQCLKRGIRPLMASFQKKSKRGKGKLEGLPVINQYVAGIDIGKSVIYVAIPPQFDEDHTRAFTTFTDDLEAIVTWLKNHKIEKVAMESTSVFWMPLFLLCEENGIKPTLVNPKLVKMLPGRKTDVLDSQWLMRLHACEMLPASFIPPKEMQALRDLARYRQDLMGRGADSLNRIQKMLSMMNIQLGCVLSDVSGKSGMAIITAIVNGERNPDRLAALADDHCKHTKEEIARALHGAYSEAPILIMKLELDAYKFYHQVILTTELKIKELLEKLPNKADLRPLPERTKARKKKREYNQSPYCFDLRPMLYQKFGYDLTIISGIEESSAATIIFETGGNLDAFPTERHFSSWSAISPGNKISGGKVLSGKAPKKFSRVGQALRVAAHANYRSDNDTGAYLRRQVRKGKSKKSARKATAHRLGIQVYNIMKYGQEYVERNSEDYEKAFEERRLLAMEKALKSAGYEVTKKLPTSAQE